MELKRVFAEDRTTARKIRSRQIKGTMKVYFDEQGYICYSKEELDNWQEKKRGRKPKTF